MGSWFKRLGHRISNACVLCCLGLGVLGARVSAAQTSLGYSVPPECPSVAWFEAELASQGVRRDALSALSVSVSKRSRELARNDALSYEGRLSFAGWQRELSSSECGELLSALAVSLVLHVESLEGAAAEPVKTESAGVGSREEPRAASFAEMGSRADPFPEGEAPAAPEGEPAVDRGSRRPGEVGIERIWRFGISASAQARSGIDPELTPGLGVALFVRSDLAGWGSGPFGVHFSATPRMRSEDVLSAGERVVWSHHWWALGGFITPGTFLFTPEIRMGPALSFSIGQYSSQGDLSGFEPKLLMFSELLLRTDVRIASGWLLDGQLGLQLPVQGFAVTPADRLLHRQSGGLVVGLGASWLGVIL